MAFNPNDFKLVDFHKFSQKMIESVSKSLPKKSDAEHTASISSTQKIKFEGEFSGMCRNISKKSHGFIKLYAKTKMPEKINAFMELYTKECQFQFGEKLIWIPIQNQIVSSLISETKKQKNVLLYCYYFGSINNEAHYGIVEFQVKKK